MCARNQHNRHFHRTPQRYLPHPTFARNRGDNPVGINLPDTARYYRHRTNKHFHQVQQPRLMTVSYLGLNCRAAVPAKPTHARSGDGVDDSIRSNLSNSTGINIWEIDAAIRTNGLLLQGTWWPGWLIRRHLHNGMGDSLRSGRCHPRSLQRRSYSRRFDDCRHPNRESGRPDHKHDAGSKTNRQH